MGSSAQRAVEAIESAAADAEQNGHRLAGFTRRCSRTGYQFTAHCRRCGLELNVHRRADQWWYALFAAGLDEHGMAALGGDGSATLSGEGHQAVCEDKDVETTVVMGMR